MAENLAEIVHHCGEDAVIRRNAKDKLYLVCRGCGVLHYSGRMGQQYLTGEMDKLNEAVASAEESLEAKEKARKREAESGGLLI